MSRARVVIGANFGDEGKGLITDYLCAQGAGVVVRFNGGAQAGHTVVTPDGRRHVFGHFGSGSFLGIPTFLSQFFVVNPLLFLKERDDLLLLGMSPVVYAHPTCLVTTFADMIINQRMEEARGAKRHGSVGVGFNETHERSNLPHLRITMADLWNNKPLGDVLAEICDKYARFRTGKPIEKPEAMIEAFTKACSTMAGHIHPAGIGQCKALDPVFEGAQGLLLSQDNKENFPHVTRSFTGMKNARLLCEQAGIDQVEAYYVSRTYLTRHGAGVLVGEDSTLRYADDTNLDHPYQGTLRFAKLDAPALRARCREDFGGDGFNLVLTHCDQEAPHCSSALTSWGPRRLDVERSTGTAAASGVLK